MFENVKIPKKLKKSPIKRAFIEIRYQSKFQDIAIYGLLNDIFEKHSSEGKFVQSPLLQLPKEIRDSDPNLRYQELYSCLDDVGPLRYIFGIGGHVIKFIVQNGYSSWTDWEEWFKPILEKISKTEIVSTIESVSFRSIDVFDKDVLHELNFNIDFGEEIKPAGGVTVGTKFFTEDIWIALNIGNNVSRNGLILPNHSMIDIECTKKIDGKNSFDNDFYDILLKEHELNKKVFFYLLKDSLLETMEAEC